MRRVLLQVQGSWYGVLIPAPGLRSRVLLPVKLSVGGLSARVMVPAAGLRSRVLLPVQVVRLWVKCPGYYQGLDARPKLISGFKYQGLVLHTRCQITVTIYRIPGYSYRVPDARLQLPYFGYQVTVTGYQIPDSSYHMSGTRLQLPNTRYQITGTIYRVPGYSYRIPDTRLHQ